MAELSDILARMRDQALGGAQKGRNTEVRFPRYMTWNARGKRHKWGQKKLERSPVKGKLSSPSWTEPTDWRKGF